MAKTRIANNVTLKAEQVEKVMDRMFSRFSKLHDRIDDRNQHFFNDSTKNPIIGNPDDADDPFRHVTRYQSTSIRDTDDKLAARLTENPPVVRCKAGTETATAEGQANDAEVTLNAWLADMEEMLGQSIVDALRPGPVREGYRVLHWYRDDYQMPMPEYEWRDQLPEGSDAKNFRDMAQWCPECMGAGTVESAAAPEGLSQTAPASQPSDIPDADAATKPCPTCDGNGLQVPDEGRYRETPDALQARYQREKAKAGSPYCFDVLKPQHVAFERGIGRQKGLAWVAVRKELSRLDYDDANPAGDDDPLDDPQSLALTPDIQQPGISGNSTSSPSGGDYTERVTLHQLWRTLPRTTGYKARAGGGFEFYEAISGHGCEGFELRKAFRLPEGTRRLPFAVCGGIRKGSDDPELEWEPYLEGMFRWKPFLDSYTTFYHAIIAMQAQPVWLNKPDRTIPNLTADGRPKGDLPNSGGSGDQAGDIMQLQWRTDPAVAQAYQTIIEMATEAIPSTGEAELSATTAPWTARIGIMLANAGPAMILRNIAATIQEAFQDIAHLCSLKTAKEGGLGEATVAYAKGADGRVNPGKTVSVEPSIWENLHVAVAINPTSSTERIAKTQHGMELLQAGLITREDFYRNYMDQEDADDYAMKVIVETAMQPYELQFIQQVAASIAGTRFLMGLNGEVVGQGGTPADPRQVLAGNGYRPAQAPQAAGPGNEATMPNLPALNAPNTPVMQGAPG